MGKAERNRQANARQRIAMQQAAAKRIEARRRILIASGSALAVVAIVVALVLVKVLGSSTASAKIPVRNSAATNTAVASAITSLPATVFDKVGAGPGGAEAVAALKSITGAPLTLNGKPEVLYIGAEFCPYCAAERWAMVAALSRFGTFSDLHFIHSTPNDVYSNTSTLTFYKSSYTSKYLSFLPLETEDVAEKPLQPLSNVQSALLTKYTQGSFPFVDVGGKYIVDGAQYLPSVLGSTATQDATHHGLTWQQIATDLKNPNSAVAQQIIAAANHITAAICQATKGQPGSVCKSTSVTSVNGSI